MGIENVREALEDFRAGRVVIIVDDESRENEGDFAVAAEKITPEVINFMAKYGRGLICLSLTGERLDQLSIPLMVEENTSKFGTAFTVSIEARYGVTTGISAADRATTILTAVNPVTQPSDIVRPGHIFPLRARPGGVLERAGQTEGAVDLARLAGLYPAGVICEVMNEDGTMARIPQLRVVAQQHGLRIVAVADIIAYRLMTETFVQQVCEADVPTEFGDFRMVVFQNILDQQNHLALIAGHIDPEKPVLVRVQSQSTMGDVFHALQCESGDQLRNSLRTISEEGQGILVYLRQEGKGGSLARELRSYSGWFSGKEVEETEQTDLDSDLRVHGIGAQILRHLGARKIRLLTNHPRKIVALQGFGISVVEQVPLEVSCLKKTV